ncbi:MAG: NAD-dependent protein deacylase [Ignavibacteria bacterium RBG_13_36_8]|nr:MAG: NAD-dependent protein deacylase [Ignavibacteria bacterium RBG_13_36_8]
MNKLKSASSILFFSGAGISSESGIPTFRGENGLWKKFKPEELANFNSFLQNPDLVWEWYQYRRKIVSESQPNPGHLAITEFEKYYPNVTVVTQNVDNLHRRAGSKKVYELHGNIERNYCIECKTYAHISEFISSDKAPRCKMCDGLVRPDVVWFGEMLPQDVFNASEKEAEKCDICFVVGTSAAVYPAIYIPITAKSSGAYLVEINIQPTEISQLVDFSIIGKSGEILPLILDEIKKFKQALK